MGLNNLPPSHLSTSQRAGAAAHSAALNKRRKYQHHFDNYNFVAFAVETFGPWCQEAKDLVLAVGRWLITSTGDHRCTSYLRQRLGIAIQLGNAASVLGSFPKTSSMEEIFL